MIGYPLDRINEEVAFLAYHFHWDYDTIMNLEHRERLHWCEEVSKINKKQNGDETRSITDI
jgi:hypothetical protein